MKAFIFIIFIGLFAISVSGCYYDNEEDLYRFSDSNCDTTNVTYSLSVAHILAANCVVCHSGSTANGNPQVFLDTYNGVKTVASNGKLMNAVNYITKPMPPSGQLNYCNIAKIRIWVNAGAPNN